VSPSCHQ